jgi:ubiquinone/menaquinone biosynthesis C-methylase UbiE
MPRITDQSFLKQEQYARSDNLSARIFIHQRFSLNPQNWYEFVFDHLMLVGTQQVLELGCGTGSLWQTCLPRIGAQACLCLSDLSPGMVANCRSLLGDDPRFGFMQCDAQHIPLGDASCDRVVANHMLYHVPNIDTCLAEICRVLKPGGWLVAATNGKRHLAELHELVHQVDPAFPIGSDANDRFGLENGPDMLHLFFDDVRVEEFDDALWVTEAEPLVAYVCSMWTASNEEAVVEQMQASFNAKIEADGGIFIQKSSGVIIASKTGAPCA